MPAPSISHRKFTRYAPLAAGVLGGSAVWWFPRDTAWEIAFLVATIILLLVLFVASLVRKPAD